MHDIKCNSTKPTSGLQRFYNCHNVTILWQNVPRNVVYFPEEDDRCCVLLCHFFSHVKFVLLLLLKLETGACVLHAEDFQEDFGYLRTVNEKD